MNRHRRRVLAATAATVIAAAGSIVLPTGPAMAQTDGTWWQQTWDMPRVWDVTDGTGVTVAVADSGVDATVPELDGAVLPGLNLREPERDGRIDYGDTGHGTAMATLIAGRDTGRGVSGIAPGADIYPIVLPGSMTLFNRAVFDIVQAAVDGHAKVLNFSVVTASGAGESCPERVAEAVKLAIENDIVVVAGVGNLAEGHDRPPANCPGVVSVGAMDETLSPWADSNRTQHVDVAAPGTGLRSVHSGGELQLSDGTSNATALVSGVVALLRAQYPDESADEIVTRLMATVQDVGEPGWDDATGHGMVRPYEALTTDPPPDAVNPVYEPLGDLTNLDVEIPDDSLPDAPDFAPEAAGGGDDNGSLLPFVAGGALLLLVLVGGLWWWLRSRRASA